MISKTLGSMDSIYVQVSEYMRSNEDKYFSKGWRQHETYEFPSHIKLLLDYSTISIKPIQIEWERERIIDATYPIIQKRGKFLSPVMDLPLECRVVEIEMICRGDVDPSQPFLLHTAATGDEGFKDRRSIAIPLAIQYGITSLSFILPFYGNRKRFGQASYVLPYVSDVFIQGMSILEECRSILSHFYHLGYHRLGITGISFGGTMAAMVAVTCPFPLAAAPCMGTDGATAVFLDGDLQQRVDWSKLGENGKEKVREYLAMFDVVIPEYVGKPRIGFVQMAMRHDTIVTKPSQQRLFATFAQSNMAVAEKMLLPGGHVSGFIFSKPYFIKGIVRSFELLNEILHTHYGMEDLPLEAKPLSAKI